MPQTRATPALFLASPALLLLAGCATAYKAGAPRGHVDVIAHRGASAYAPENTLPAFQLAAEQGAHWFELDCRITADNEIVVIHDADLERTTGANGLVWEKNLAELKELDAGAWFAPEFAGTKIPTLGESLDFAKDRIGVYVEIKSCDEDNALIEALADLIAGHDRLTPRLRHAMMRAIEESGTRNLELTRRTIAEIRARNMKRQVVIQSFSPVVCFIARIEAPDLRIEFLGGDDPEKPGDWPLYVAYGNLIKVRGFNVDDDALTQARIAQFRHENKYVAAWTVDEPETMTQLAEWGVTGIITNRPDLALKTLADHRQAMLTPNSALASDASSIQ